MLAAAVIVILILFVEAWEDQRDVQLTATEIKIQNKSITVFYPTTP
jgi:hypothetical protein